VRFKKVVNKLKEFKKKLNQAHIFEFDHIHDLTLAIIFGLKCKQLIPPKKKPYLLSQSSTKVGFIFFVGMRDPSSLEEKWPSGRCLNTFQLLRA
jgi:hypothetical protein